MSLYFIAIEPNAELTEKIREVQKDFAERFSSQKSYRSFPHMTVIPPFHYDEQNESEVVGHFLKAEITVSPFEIELKGFGSFEHPKHPVIYIKPENSEELNLLFNELDKSMDGFNRINSFRPHLTVAYRDLSFADFQKAWKEYGDREFRDSFTVDRVMLYKHFDSRWNEIAHRILK